MKRSERRLGLFLEDGRWRTFDPSFARISVPVPVLCQGPLNKWVDLRPGLRKIELVVSDMPRKGPAWFEIKFNQEGYLTRIDGRKVFIETFQTFETFVLKGRPKGSRVGYACIEYEEA